MEQMFFGIITGISLSMIALYIYLKMLNKVLVIIEDYENFKRYVDEKRFEDGQSIAYNFTNTNIDIRSLEKKLIYLDHEFKKHVNHHTK